MSLSELPERALLLDDARPQGRTLLFQDPVEWIEVHALDAVPEALARLDAAVRDGLYVAGAFGFELGYVLEPRLTPLWRQGPDPLIAVGLYRTPAELDAMAMAEIAAGRSVTIGVAQPTINVAAYEAAFAKVHGFIAAGDVYQVNLTFPLEVTVEGDPLARLAHWRAQTRAGHAAVMRLGDRDVISFSPELFIAVDTDGRIRARPMKGTVARGPDGPSDAAAKAALVVDPKQRAENLMIVDLLRNDLSRVCEVGSVRVSDLFTPETYPTLHTLTSGIEGQLQAGTTPSVLLRALFPCGSVTGAPKVRAMEIIAEVERFPRGFYCGSMGYFAPDGSASLNVAIRTMVHAQGSGVLRLGVGGGIVHDSVASAEYEEALLKARFATRAERPFQILETMRWEATSGFVALDLHLARMRRAADYFGYPIDEAVARSSLEDHVVAAVDGALRVRLLLDRHGGFEVQSTALENPFVTPDGADTVPMMHLAVVRTRIDANDPFARHKTTQRAPYDAALEEAKAAGADEAVLLNQSGRVADGSYMSIFVRRGDHLLTPPASEGALDGVLKAMLAEGPLVVEEVALSADDLRLAEMLYVGNSVRGIRRARLAK